MHSLCELYSCGETMNSLLSPYPKRNFLILGILLVAIIVHLLYMCPENEKRHTLFKSVFGGIFKSSKSDVVQFREKQAIQKHCNALCNYAKA